MRHLRPIIPPTFSPPERPLALLTSRALVRSGMDGRQCRRAVLAGRMVHIKRGAFCERNIWDTLSDRERHLMRVFAVAETSREPVFSHWSAAAVHGLLTLRPFPADVFVIADRATGGRSEPGIRRFCTGMVTHDTRQIGELRVTSIERTIADIALIAPFGPAVATADSALRGARVDPRGLEEYLAVASPARGRKRIARVFEFASPLAENPGESLSRVVLQEIGAPAPLLQVEHRMRNGIRYFTDFEWPEWGVIGEFDGKAKYLKQEMLNGRDPGEAVYEEKRREDRIRAATGARFARWGWDEVRQPTLLRSILTDAGLPVLP